MFKPLDFLKSYMIQYCKTFWFNEVRAEVKKRSISQIDFWFLLKKSYVSIYLSKLNLIFKKILSITVKNLLLTCLPHWDPLFYPTIAREATKIISIILHLDNAFSAANSSLFIRETNVHRGDMLFTHHSLF